MPDILAFLERSRLVIAGMIVACLLLASAYIATAEKRFEAIVELQLAQANHNPIEAPSVLIQRLRMPTTYTTETLQHCEISQDDGIGEFMGGKLKVVAIKGTTDLVEIKVTASSSNQSVQCAEALVSMIVAQQGVLSEQYLSTQRMQLAQYQQEAIKEQQQLERIRKSELVNFAYLAQQDRSVWLWNRIESLQNEILAVKPAKLITPIYSPPDPVSPKALLTLVLGALIGATVGVFAALFREHSRKFA